MRAAGEPRSYRTSCNDVTKLLLAGLPAPRWVPLSMAEGDAIGGHGEEADRSHDRALSEVMTHYL
jgi:hypothetical protein